MIYIYQIVNKNQVAEKNKMNKTEQIKAAKNGVYREIKSDIEAALFALLSRN